MTTASLRGIHAAGPGVAWASGTNGTVLRTEDAGFVWQRCAMPSGAEKLDFRGVWAWDAMTAVVMSSGPGEQSRLYKTTDGCATWTLLLTNGEKDGFWDAIAFADREHGWLLGDPVNGKIVLLRTVDGGAHWSDVEATGLEVPDAKTGFFAASNSSMMLAWDGAAGIPWLATGSARSADGGWHGPFLLAGDVDCPAGTGAAGSDACLERFRFRRHAVPLAGGSDAAGIFSIDARYNHGGIATVVAVGGDYTKPSDTSAVAARYRDGGSRWVLSAKPPHGYRSAVAWDAGENAWVTAGPNGTDYSRDDGRTWQRLENGAWNAISLPYLVGPGGRIGKLVLLPTDGQNAHSTNAGKKTGSETRR